MKKALSLILLLAVLLILVSSKKLHADAVVADVYYRDGVPYDPNGEIFFTEPFLSETRVREWITEYCQILGAKIPAQGAVFEVRQGYKSKDSKRQNADIDNIAVAWAQGYMPVFAIFSGQMDADLDD